MAKKLLLPGPDPWQQSMSDAVKHSSLASISGATPSTTCSTGRRPFVGLWNWPWTRRKLHVAPALRLPQKLPRWQGRNSIAWRDKTASAGEQHKRKRHCSKVRWSFRTGAAIIRGASGEADAAGKPRRTWPGVNGTQGLPWCRHCIAPGC